MRSFVFELREDAMFCEELGNECQCIYSGHVMNTRLYNIDFGKKKTRAGRA